MTLSTDLWKMVEDIHINLISFLNTKWKVWSEVKDEVITDRMMNNERGETSVGGVKGMIPRFQEKCNKETCMVNIKKFELVRGVEHRTQLLKIWFSCYMPEILGANKAQGCSWGSVPRRLQPEVFSQPCFLFPGALNKAKGNTKKRKEKYHSGAFQMFANNVGPLFLSLKYQSRGIESNSYSNIIKTKQGWGCKGMQETP